MKTKKVELSSPSLKKLEKDLARVQKADLYLEKEKRKLMQEKEKIRVKIRKEKEILKLKEKIKKVKSSK